MQKFKINLFFYFIVIIIFSINISFAIEIKKKSAPLITNLKINKYMVDNKDILYIYYNDNLYYNYNKKGDCWSGIIFYIKSISIDPTNDKVYYLITKDNEIKKKLGEKNKYITIMNGLPNITYNTIRINPYDTNEIYLGSQQGIYKTIDSGFTWEHVAFDENIQTILINPKDQSKLIVLTDKGLFSSTDALKNCKNADKNLPKLYVKKDGRTAKEITVPIDLIAYAFTENTIKILAATQKGLFISKDDGQSWVKVVEGIDKQFYDHKVSSFYFNKATYYLGTEKAIYKSENLGTSWKRIDFSDINFNIGAIIGISDNKKNGLMLNDDNGNIFYYRNDGKVICLNSGVMTHSIIHNIESKVVADTIRVYTVVENNYYTDIDRYGIFFTEDGGLSWKKCLTYKKPYGADPRLYISPINNEIWHFTNYENSFYYSEDNGTQWSKINKFNFKYLNDNISDFEFDPIRENIKYICAGVNDYSIFRYDQKTSNSTDLKVDATNILIEKNNSKKILTNTLKVSIDGGWTWQDLSENVYKVVRGESYIPIFFQSNEILIYVKHFNNSLENNYKDFLISSKDLGKTWKIIKTIKKQMYNIYVNPNNNNNIFIVLDNLGHGYDYENNPKKNSIDIIVTYDRGVSWKTIYKYKLSNQDKVINNSATIQCIHVTKNNDVFIGGSIGLKKMLKAGNSWKILGGIQ